MGDTRLSAGTQVRRLVSRYNDLIQTGDASMREVFKGASAELDAWATFWQAEIVRLGAADGDSIEVAKLHCKLMVRALAPHPSLRPRSPE